MPEAGYPRRDDDPEGGGRPGGGPQRQEGGFPGRRSGDSRRTGGGPAGSRDRSGQGRPGRSGGSFGGGGRGGDLRGSPRSGGQGFPGRRADRDGDRDGRFGPSGDSRRGTGRSGPGPRGGPARAGGTSSGAGGTGFRRGAGFRRGFGSSSAGRGGGGEGTGRGFGSGSGGAGRDASWREGDRRGGPRQGGFRQDGDRRGPRQGGFRQDGDRRGPRQGGFRQEGDRRGGGFGDRRPQSGARRSDDTRGGSYDDRRRSDTRGGSYGGRRDGRPGDRVEGRGGRPGRDQGPARRDGRSTQGEFPRSGSGRGGAGWAGSEERRSGPPVNRNWGGVARRGARNVSGGGDLPGGDRTSASQLWREAVSRSEEARGRPPGGEWEPEETWVLEPDDDDAAVPAPAPGRPAGRSPRPPAERDQATGREGAPSPGGRRRSVPKPVVDELASAAGNDRGSKLANRMGDATYAYEKERYQEARRILRSLAEEVPESASVRELYGLVLYRTGQWVAAAKQLEVFRELSGSYDQHPALADCYRALQRYDDAEQVWNDLREASPSGDLVAEGRIVAAGCRADRGDLAGAILMLEKAARKVAKPQERHLRQWYALADLYERAGDVVRARDLFNRVASVDPDAFDVRARLRALR